MTDYVLVLPPGATADVQVRSGGTPPPPPAGTNVALGGAVTSSGDISASYPASAVINGDQKGLNWAAGGGWNSAVLPAWLQIVFNGTKRLDHVDIYTLQDNFNSPVEPTDTMQCNQYGIEDFAVQYWDGSAWQPYGAPITGNNLVKRAITATAITNAIRINVTAARALYARIVEVEAYGVPDSTVLAPPGTATGPVTGGLARALPGSSYSGFAFGDYARPDYSHITHDAARARILFGLGGGHQSNPAIGKDTNIMAFPMATKVWEPLYPSMTETEIEATTMGPDGLFVSTRQPSARHTYAGTIVLGKWFCVLTDGGSSGYGKACRCDLTAPTIETTWEQTPQAPGNYVVAVAPTLDGRALVANTTGGNWGTMFLYDPATNTMTQLGAEGVFGAWGSTGALAYFPPNDRFYFLGPNYKLFEYAFNAANPTASTWQEVVYTGPVGDAAYVTLSYDAGNRTLGGCVANGTYWAVDPVAKVAKKVTLVVEAGSSGVPNTLFHCAARDPVSNHLYAVDAGVTWEINPPTF